MRAYIIRRLLLIIPTLFILTVLVFLSVRFIPGDVIDLMVMRMGFFEGEGVVDREAMKRMLGLDVPVYVQYGRWIGVLPTPDWVTGESHFKGLLQGTLGESLMGGGTVEDRILNSTAGNHRAWFVMTIVIGLVIGLPVGIYSAIRQDTAADYVGRTIGRHRHGNSQLLAGNLMVMIFPVIWWGWSPPMRVVSFHRRPARESWRC